MKLCEGLPAYLADVFGWDMPVRICRLTWKRSRARRVGSGRKEGADAPRGCAGNRHHGRGDGPQPAAVWSRRHRVEPVPGRAAPLAADGAQEAWTAAEAVTEVDAVVTMLWDGGSVAEVMTAALPAAPGGVLWAQTSTVSLHDAGVRLPTLASRHRGPVC